MSETIVLTSAGGKLVPEIMAQLRASHRIQPRIVALDVASQAAAFDLADAHYVVPAGSDAGYRNTVLEICRREHARVIVPLSDEEACVLADAREVFAKHGCVVLGSPASSTRTAADKGALLAALATHGIQVPRYFCPRTRAQFDQALADLGFPAVPVAFKPTVGRGGRGFRVLVERLDELAQILKTREERFVTASRIAALVAAHDEPPSFMVMEYLEGPHYSVDVLLRGGLVAALVTQEKRTDAVGNILSTRVVDIPAVSTTVRQIAAAIPFEFLINIDLGRRASDGAILPYEINARASALISGTAVTGIRFLEEALCQAMEMPPLDIEPRIDGQVQHMTSRYASAA